LGLAGIYASLYISKSSGRSPSAKPQNLIQNLDSVGVLLVITYLSYVVGFHSLANLPLNEGLLYGVHMRFWQQPNIIVFIWAGIGLIKLYSLLHSITEKATVANAFCTAISIGCVLWQCKTWYHLCDQSNGWWAAQYTEIVHYYNQLTNPLCVRYIHNYAKSLLEPLPRNALLFVNYDLQWTSIRYLQICEGFRYIFILWIYCIFNNFNEIELTWLL